tara:strand:- start:160 stop:282 length:123 start_codon:yes stop_codon:yes gene_type:complete
MSVGFTRRRRGAEGVERGMWIAPQYDRHKTYNKYVIPEAA